MNIQRTPFASAPSAMRTPISWTRRVTLYESTPYSPTAPSTSASAAAIPTITIVNDNPAIALATRPCIVNTRYIGDSGTTSWMIARTSGASCPARDDFSTYAGDVDTAGRYTIGAGVWRRMSSTLTSSTTTDDGEPRLARKVTWRAGQRGPCVGR